MCLLIEMEVGGVRQQTLAPWRWNRATIGSVTALGVGAIGLGWLVGPLSITEAAGSPREAPSSEASLPSPSLDLETDLAVDPTLVPARMDENDGRSPLERLLGVPSDPGAALEWEWDMMQRGLTECMAERDWPYTPITFDASQDPESVDPNWTYFEGLDDEARIEYAAARWGTIDGPQSGCEVEASNRSHPLNSMKGEHQALKDTIVGDPRLAPALASMTECVQAGDPASKALVDECGETTGYREASRVVVEEQELQFITAHIGRLTELMEQRP